MIIDCISDLHGFYPKLEGGDLLIVAGDLTAGDTPLKHLEFIEWCRYLPYRKIIVIAGNHDNFLQKLKSKYFGMPVYHDHCEYLCDSATEFEGLKIWGSPWTKTFKGMNPKCKAFTCDTEEELYEKFVQVPPDTDILITHSPPYGILDKNFKDEHCGSKSLRNITLDGSYFKKFRYHIFGHIHEMGNHQLDLNITRFINASHVNEHYQPVNKPIRVIL